MRVCQRCGLRLHAYVHCACQSTLHPCAESFTFPGRTREISSVLHNFCCLLSVATAERIGVMTIGGLGSGMHLV